MGWVPRGCPGSKLSICHASRAGQRGRRGMRDRRDGTGQRHHGWRRAASAPGSHHQALRRLHRPRVRLARGRTRRVRRLPGAVGVRQDDTAQDHRRTRAPDRRPHLPGRTRDFGVAARPARLRHRVSVLCPVPQPHRLRQRGLWSQERAAREPAHRREGRRAARHGRPPRGGRQVSWTAFRRSATADRRRPGDCRGARAASARRAAERARRPGPRAPAPRAQAASAPPRPDHRHGHPRSGGGPDPGRPHRGDESRGHRAGRIAPGNLPETDDPRSSPTSSAP